MNTALAQIQEEIAKLEERLRLLRAAEEALQRLENKDGKLGGKISPNSPSDNPPVKGLAAAIRGFLKEKGPMTKADLDKALSNEKWSLPKAGISGALQAMRVKGVVARSKAGKWTLK